MNFEILRPGKDFSAAGKRAREGFLTGVNPYVVNKFVLCLEGPAVTRTSLPEARVRGALGTAHVFHREVRHDIVEGVEEFTAQLPSGSRRILIYPHAGHLLPLAACNPTGSATAASVASHIP